FFSAGSAGSALYVISVKKYDVERRTRKARRKTSIKQTGSLHRAPLERGDSHAVLVEPVAVARECLGKDSDVVAYGFGDDIEVAARLGSRARDFVAQTAAKRVARGVHVPAGLRGRCHDFSVQPVQPGAQPGDRSPELRLVDLGAFHAFQLGAQSGDRSAALQLVDLGSFQPVEPPVQPAFSFALGRAPSRTTDHSIVAPAKTVPWG